MANQTKSTGTAVTAVEADPTAMPPTSVDELPTPEELAGAVVPVAKAKGEQKQHIQTLMNEIDIEDSNSIIFFGAKAQEEVTSIADGMLGGVRNKDTGPAGEALNEMVATLRGFRVGDLDPNKKPGFFARLFGGVKPIVKFLQRYENVTRQIDAISNRLDSHKTKLMVDVESLDRLYDATLDYFHDLADYIAAGEAKLEEFDKKTIPAAQKKADESQDVLDAQKLRDIRQARDDLERRVHDLKLTRQIAMQSLPSIRLVQENDKALVTKINSTMVNTIPLWRQQLAQAVTIYRAGEAAKTIKEATDLTNDLLLANAENLRQANREVREQVERGIVDIETVKKANEQLIATIEDSLQIADEGKRKRREAEGVLQGLEKDLRDSLAAAHAHQQQSSTQQSAS